LLNDQLPNPEMRYPVSYCIFIILIFNSCTPYLYFPTTPNIPLPEKKHELNFNTGISTGGIYLQGSYALNSHLLVLADYARYGTENTTGYRHFWHCETGLGYFTSISKKFRLEMIGGYARGKVSGYEYQAPFTYTYHFKNIYDYNNDINRFFIQPDFAYISKGKDFCVKAGFSFKTSYLTMENLKYRIEQTNYDMTSIYYDSSLNLSNKALYFEPSAFIDGSIYHFDIKAGIGISTRLGAKDDTWNNHSLGFPVFIYMAIGAVLFND
jgi:hypothetical protein